MFDTSQKTNIDRVNEARAGDRMRVHAMLVIIYAILVGIGVQFEQIWLWLGAGVAAAFSIVRYLDHRGRWRASDPFRGTTLALPDESTSAAGGHTRAEQSIFKTQAGGVLRQPSAGTSD